MCSPLSKSICIVGSEKMKFMGTLEWRNKEHCLRHFFIKLKYSSSIKRIAILSNETHKGKGVAFGHSYVMAVIRTNENPGFIEYREDCFYLMQSGGYKFGFVCEIVVLNSGFVNAALTHGYAAVRPTLMCVNAL
jgi:hypothetical protein